jgi:2-polyprenyl-3-methyl-5-hydroxy-6-metoxy-1,4-benzoquinol methylase
MNTYMQSCDESPGSNRRLEMRTFDDNDALFYDYEYFFGSADMRVFSRAHGGRYRFLLPYLKSHFSGLKILDVGCGSGYLTKWLADLGNQVIGTDNSIAAIEICRDRYPDLEFIRASVYDLADIVSDRKFDLVTSFDVIEHLHDQERFLKIAGNLLAPGGRLLLTTDNMDFLQQRSPLVSRIHWLGTWFSHDARDFRMIKRSENVKFAHLGRETYSRSHVGLLRPSELEDLLAKSGFATLEHHFYPLFRVWLYDALTTWVPRANRYESVLFLAERKSQRGAYEKQA